MKAGVLARSRSECDRRPAESWLSDLSICRDMMPEDELPLPVELLLDERLRSRRGN